MLWSCGKYLAGTFLARTLPIWNARRRFHHDSVIAKSPWCVGCVVIATAPEYLKKVDAAQQSMDSMSLIDRSTISEFKCSVSCDGSLLSIKVCRAHTDANASAGRR